MRAWILLVVLSLGLAALHVLAPAATADGVEAAGSSAGARSVTHLDTWHLLQGSGASLYMQLCAGCHGVDGSGRTIAVGGDRIMTPALNRLRAAGVPERHWTYVITSPCDDVHHGVGRDGQIMPCWRTIFRETLNNEMLPLLVSAKLKDHLETIQR